MKLICNVAYCKHRETDICNQCCHNYDSEYEQISFDKAMKMKP